MEKSKVIIELEDLFLLEGFQIGNLPRVSLKRELAAVLHAYPKIHRFLISKNPSISPFISKIMNEYGPSENPKNSIIIKIFADSLIGENDIRLREDDLLRLRVKKNTQVMVTPYKQLSGHGKGRRSWFSFKK